MRKHLMLWAIFCLLSAVSFAQSKPITGKVTDQSGQPVPFVTVHVKGSKQAVVADADGNFTIKASLAEVLVITGTGFVSKEVPITGAGSISVQVERKNASLTEVVVTALGVKTAKKGVGFGVQDIKGTDLVQGQQGNMLQAMSGKVAGMEVTSSSGTPGAASYIKLRGFTSFNGDAQPLIVIDGVPIDNSTTGMSLGNVAQSNRGVDINPDDIENVSVLKGPSASALYGTQGTDGVILITTKKGRKPRDGSKFDINYSYGATWDVVSNLPKLQMKYGQGTNGQIRGPLNGTSTSFGPLLDTVRRTGVANVWDPQGDIVGQSSALAKVPVHPYDNLKQFFRTGLTQQHEISLGSGNDNTSYRFSYSNLYQTGIAPKSDFSRNTFTLSVDTRLSDAFKTGANISYINSGGNRVQEGSNLSGILLGLARTPNTFDNSYGSNDPNFLAAYQLPDGTERTYRGKGDGTHAYYDNPYWTVNKNLYNDNVNRLLANAYLTFTPASWFTVTDRLGTDLYSDNRKQSFALFSAGQQTGQVTYNNNNYRHVNNDLMVTLSKQDIANGLNGSLLLGNNLYQQTFTNNFARGTGLTVPDFYDLSNTATQLAGASSSVLRRIAFYANAKFDYNNYLFLELSLRAENSSAFISSLSKKGNWSYFPAANASFVFTDAFHLKSDVLSFGKIRAAYGQAGRLPALFQTSTYYSSGTVGDGWTNGDTYPINGQQGFFAGSLGNLKLKPERTSSLDLGADLRFLKDRAGISFTYYNAKSSDLLLQVPISPSSGYGSEYTNSAKVENHGVELTVNGTPVKTSYFSWDITVNWSFNRSKVTALGPGITTLGLGGFTNGAVNAVVGQPFGMIYGVGYLKDPVTGKTVINDAPAAANGSPYGYPIQDPNSRALGNPNPKWIGGIQNTFNYKAFSLRVLFDTKQKFEMWDGTRGALVNFGTAAETVTRGQAKVFDGVTGHLDASGNLVNGTGNKPGAGGANTTSVNPGQAWYQRNGSGFTVVEPFIEDASFAKLREVAVSYNFVFNNAKARKYIKGVNVSFIGRNLALWTKYKGVDPETSLAGARALGIDYFNNPGTRSYGFNVKVNL